MLESRSLSKQSIFNFGHQLVKPGKVVARPERAYACDSSQVTAGKHNRFQGDKAAATIPGFCI